MMTGDASINRDAPIVCCTAEILANMALRDGAIRAPAYVVMDEFHYYADRERGMAWQVPLLTLRRDDVPADVGDAGRHARDHRGPAAPRPGARSPSCAARQRPVPLEFEYRETPLHETIDELVKSGRAPIYLVNFTQRAAAEEAQNLMSVDLSSKAEKEAIRAALDGGGVRQPLRQGAPALPAPRHRHPPRGPAAQVPAAGRAAGAEGPAQGGQRHRHAGRRRQHPDPHRAVHAAVQVRRREDRHPGRARVPADRRARRAQGLRRARLRGRAGARARRREPAPRGQAGAGQEGRHAEAAQQGLRALRQAAPSNAWSAARPSRSSRASRSPTACCCRCLQGGRDAERARASRAAAATGACSSIIARSHGGPRQQRAQRRRAAACFRTLRHAGIIDVVPYEAARGRVVEVSGAAAARLLAAPHAVAVPGRHARACSIATRRPTRWTC